jgi:cobalt-zinc-cadmium efflux system outer membrane protein
MWARARYLVHAGWVLLLGLACASAAPSAPSEYLRAEWRVGQEQTSPWDLEVIAPPPAPAELSLEDAVALALRHNLGFRMTIQRLLSAQSTWRVAKQRWSLELFGRIERTGNGETVEERQAGLDLSYAAVTGADLSVVAELDRLESEEGEHSVTALLRQPLLAGRGSASAAYEELRRARNAYRAALMSFFVERQGLIEQVISSYLNAVQQQQLVSIRQSSVTMAEEAVRDADLRLKEQYAVKLDLMRAQLRLAGEQTAEVLAKQSLADTTDRLLTLLGLQVGGMPKLVTQVTYQPRAIDLDASIAQALELRPELRLIDLATEDREAVLRIARSHRLPSLDLFGAWQRTTNGVEDRSWGVGLELSVPIASRSLNEAARQARWDLLVAEQEREVLVQQIIAEVRAEVRAARAARQNVEIAAKSVDVAKESLAAAQRMVEEGLRTNLYVLDAQDDLTRDETSLVTSKINYYLASVRLQRAMGLDVSQDLPGSSMTGPPGDSERPSEAPGVREQ